MQFSITAGLLALAASVAALSVTSPGQGAVVDLTKSYSVTWTSVNTDQTSFNIVLVNQQVNPSVNINVASNVQTSAGSFSISGLSGVTPGNGYQFNLISTVNNGILAQSQQFTVSSSGGSTSAGSSASAATSSAPGGVTTSSGSPSIPTSLSSPAISSVSGVPGGSSNSSSTYSSPSLPKSTGAAAKLPVVASAGTLLMGFFALVL
jgi:hypothetical protein